jgi:Bacterial CdiA-CT RNAse A domain
VGAGLAAARQGAQVVDGDRKSDEFSFEEVAFGAVAGGVITPIAAPVLAAIPELGTVLAAGQVANGSKEAFVDGNYATGLLDAGTAVAPLFGSKGARQAALGEETVFGANPASLATRQTRFNAADEAIFGARTPKPPTGAQPAYAGAETQQTTTAPTTEQKPPVVKMESTADNVPSVGKTEPIPSTPKQSETKSSSLENQGYRPQPGERSTTKIEYYGNDGKHRINRSVRKQVFDGDASELSQPGGLKATEGTQITDASGKYTGKPGPQAHPLDQHGPETPLSQVEARVGSGKGQVRQSTRFLDRSKMEAAIKQTTDARKVEIDNWIKTNPPAGEKFPVSHDPKLGNLGEVYKFNKTTNSADKIEAPLNECKVVLKSDGKGNYIIQTAFPQ